MPKFIVHFSGECEVVKAKDLAEAENKAFEAWLQAADQDYSAEPYSAEAAKEYGLEEPTEHPETDDDPEEVTC